MFRRLRGWWDLPGRDKFTVVIFLFLLPLISLSLWAAGYVRTRRWIEGVSPAGNPHRADEFEMQSAQRLTQLAEIVGRRGAITATCLRQSLLVYGILRRHGLAPELKLGVRKIDGKLDAHAWVQLEQTALGQGDAEHTPLPDHEPLQPSVR